MKEYPQKWSETTKNHKKSFKISNRYEKYWKLAKNKKFNKNHLKSTEIKTVLFGRIFTVF